MCKGVNLQGCKSSKYYDYQNHYIADENNKYMNLLKETIKKSPDYDEICDLALKYHNIYYADNPIEFYINLKLALKIPF